jgi:UDP-glucose 4-epimerase
MKTVAITGSSGYLGSALVKRLKADGVRVIGFDISEPGDVRPDEFMQADLTKAESVALIQQVQPDTIIHSAFAFIPRHNRRLWREINIQGTRHVFEAAAAIKPQRLMIVSSATAYGAWPDNPVPMTEDWPIRSRKEFQYAADKTEIEGMTSQFAGQHNGINVASVRPAIIGGPKMENYIRNFILTVPILAKLGGQDTPLQFVHEEDVTAAIATILEHDGRGVFNIGPPDWTSTSEIAEAAGRWLCPYMPFWLAWLFAWLHWNARILPNSIPSGFLYFTRYPWVVAPVRLQGEYGFEFRYTSNETMRQVIAAR